MASNREYTFTLIDLLGRQVRAAGGTCLVTVNGAYNKVSLFDAAGVALANPIALNQGKIYFQTAKATSVVDLWIMTPGGQFIIQKGVIAGSLQEIPYDAQALQTLIAIPWSKVDTTAAVETDTGFDLPLDCLVLPDIALDVTTLEAAKTIDFGTLSSEGGGDADGFAVAITLAAATMVAAKSAATATRGALVGAGTLDRAYSQSLNAAKSISYTLLAATTVAAGIILLPVVLSPKRFASAA